jgi:hypothetical protein
VSDDALWHARWIDDPSFRCRTLFFSFRIGALEPGLARRRLRSTARLLLNKALCLQQLEECCPATRIATVQQLMRPVKIVGHSISAFSSSANQYRRYRQHAAMLVLRIPLIEHRQRAAWLIICQSSWRRKTRVSLSCPRCGIGAHFLNPDHVEAPAAVPSRRGE